MAKALLVSFAGYPYALSSLFPDNGLASLAAVLRSEGHECRIYDYNTAELIGQMVDGKSREMLDRLFPKLHSGLSPEALATLLTVSKRIEERGRLVVDRVAAELVGVCRREKIDFVGFKLWSGDGFGASVAIANRVHNECPKVFLFAGGPAVHYSGHIVATEAPVFDAVIDGDGEQAIIELARYVEGRRTLDQIPNRVRASGEPTVTAAVPDLSALPMPAYGKEVYPSLWDGRKIKMLSVDESRGCPMRCAFCVNWCIEGSTWRTRSPAQVIQEICAFGDELGSRAFRLAGTYSPPSLVRSICREIIDRNLKVTFSLSLHAGGVDPTLLVLLRQAGCFGVFVGVESGSDAILRKAMNKSVDSARLRSVLRASLDTGLFTVGSFIFPTPFQTVETEEETRKFIREVFSGEPNSAVIVTFPALIPRTYWWRQRSQYGFDLDIGEDEYHSMLAHYKIKHIVPANLWAPLPYRLNGCPQPELARRATAFQAWVQNQGIGVNLPDHDAQIGVALGYSPFEFQNDLRRMVFAGDAEGLQSLVNRANEALSR